MLETNSETPLPTLLNQAPESAALVSVPVGGMSAQQWSGTEVDDERFQACLAAFPQVIKFAQAGQVAQAAELAIQIQENVREFIPADHSGMAEFLFAYVGFLELTFRGGTKLRLGQTMEALAIFQQAVSAGRDKVLPVVARGLPIPITAAAMELEVATSKVNVLLARLLLDLRDEKFVSAQHQASKAVKTCQEIVESAQLLNNEGINLLVTATEFQMRVAKSLGLFAGAEAARQAKSWDEALAGYDETQDAIFESGEYAARMGIPVGDDAQVSLLNSALIPIARLRLEENRTLVADGERKAREIAAVAESRDTEALKWKAAFEALKGMSPSVHIQNENVINADFTQNVTYVAKERLGEDLNELSEAISSAPLASAERTRLTEEIAQLKAAKDEKGEGYFKKTAEFAENAVKILKGVKEAAGPLTKVVKWVIPFAPIAAHMLGLS